MQKRKKRLLGLVECLCIAMIFGMIGFSHAKAKADIGLNHKKIVLQKGKSKTLKLKAGKKAVKGKKIWVSSDKKVATVNKKGKVKAKKSGKCVIKCKYKRKIYRCRVSVQGNADNGNTGNSDVPAPTPLPKQPNDVYFQEMSVCNYYIKYDKGQTFLLSNFETANVDYVINKSSIQNIPITYNGQSMTANELKPGHKLNVYVKGPQTCEYPHTFTDVTKIEVTDYKPELLNIIYTYNVKDVIDGDIYIEISDSYDTVLNKNYFKGITLKKVTLNGAKNADISDIKKGDKLRLMNDAGEDVGPSFISFTVTQIDIIREYESVRE